jgi:cytochrome c553
MFKTLFAAPVLAVALAALPAHAQSAAAGDPAKGREKVQMCQGCHGIEGWRTAFPEVYKVPRLAGQHEAYLVKALQAYKSGERSHPSMKAIAATLTDQDMANLAAYYAQPAARTAGK